MAAALIVCRFLHFGAAMLLFGAGVFSGVLAPETLGAALRRAWRWPVRLLAMLLVVTAIAWLMLETGEIGDGWSDVANPATILSVLTATSFGMAWSVHLLLVAALVATLALDGRPGARGLAAASGLVLASFGFIGHAADQEGAVGLAHRANHALHLLSGGFWLGCLPPLLLTLWLSRRNDLRHEAGRALRRFSSLGHGAVALVVLTGAINTAFIVGGLPTDIDVPYQRLLLLKIALVGAMVVIALLNRYVAVPRLARGPGARRGLVIGTLAELALGIMVIALVSAFATFDPTPMDMDMG